MEFTDKIADDLLRVDFAAVGKDDALRKIAAIAVGSPLLKDIGAEAVYAKLVEREAAVSTGIGGGIAIPHARIKGLADFLVFILVAPRPIEFEALDKKKVQIFFVVFAPEEQVNEHLKLLASISRAMSHGNLKKELLNTSSPEVLREVVARTTGGQSAVPAAKDGKMKLLLLVLYYENDLREVLEFLLDQGIEGSTIIDSKGMGAYVSSMPLFASFLGFMREDRNSSRVVMTMIPANDERKFVDGIENIVGDLDKTQGAMLMTIDIAFHKGTMNMI